MPKVRLDQLLVTRGLVTTRSQAESWIRLGKVFVNGQAVSKPGFFVAEDVPLELKTSERYVSRAGLKLASVAEVLHLDFNRAVVLDVGSSTGGFTDYALQHGAKKVIAVDVGTDQLHPSLHDNPNIALYEQTDIRDVHFYALRDSGHVGTVLIHDMPDIVVIDVSFISLREILPHLAKIVVPKTKLVAMLKPQFEAGSSAKHKGVIKNDAVRRAILKDFESWAKNYFVILDKSDSQVTGTKGNRERFYLLQKL